jgi:hypothetical protein
MSTNDHQTYFEQSPDPTSVLIEDYRGLGTEQVKPYPAEHHIIPATASAQQESEPKWITNNRDLTRMNWLRRWVMRRVGDDDPVLYQAVRNVVTAAVVAILLIIAALSGIPGYSAPLSVPLGYTLIDDSSSWRDILRGLAVFSLYIAAAAPLGLLVSGLRVRSNCWRSSHPQLAHRLTWLVIVLAPLLLAAAAVGIFFTLSYYVQHGG